MVGGGRIMGTTLCILYAGRFGFHILIGIARHFLASQCEMDWYFQPLRALVPQASERLTAGWTQAKVTCFHRIHNEGACSRKVGARPVPIVLSDTKMSQAFILLFKNQRIYFFATQSSLLRY